MNYGDIVYVGDNVNKDFQAPHQLAMRSVFYKNKNGLYEENECNTLPCMEIIVDIVTILG